MTAKKNYSIVMLSFFVLFVLVGLTYFYKLNQPISDTAVISGQEYIDQHEVDLIQKGDDESLFYVAMWGKKTPLDKRQEILIMLADRNYPFALRELSKAYWNGSMGFKQDCTKAKKLRGSLKEKFPQYLTDTYPIGKCSE